MRGPQPPVIAIEPTSTCALLRTIAHQARNKLRLTAVPMVAEVVDSTARQSGKARNGFTLLLRKPEGPVSSRSGSVADHAAVQA
jgi:hypothetical protein